MARSRRWGWHQLEPRWAERLVASAPIEAGSLVVDVGAGAGAITTELLAAGARVIAVEAHHGRADELRERFGDRGVVVVRADAADLRLPLRPYHLVANPPFAITGPLLRRVLQRGSRLRSATVILQEQAAPAVGGPVRAGRQPVGPALRCPPRTTRSPPCLLTATRRQHPHPRDPPPALTS